MVERALAKCEVSLQHDESAAHATHYKIPWKAPMTNERLPNELQDDVITKIAQQLQALQSVPLPGGHGVVFEAVPRLYHVLPQPPVFAARCFLALALLGQGRVQDDDDSEGTLGNPQFGATGASKPPEKWNCKEWWPHAAVWYARHCGHIPIGSAHPYWRYLLAGIRRVVTEHAMDLAGGVRTEAEKLKGRALDNEEAAAERLRKHLRNRLNPIPLKLEADPYEPAMPLTAEWKNVCKELGGPKADLVLTMYFLHTYHALLGLGQVPLDVHYGAPRRPFFERIARMLDDLANSQTGLSETARRVAVGMRITRLLNESGACVELTSGLAVNLPSCFRLAHAKSAPPKRALVDNVLRADERARNLILNCHDLALILADAAMDFTRVLVGDDILALTSTEYSYMTNRTTYIRTEFEKLEAANAVPQGDAVAGPDQAIGRGPMTRSFATRMSEEALVQQCRAILQHEGMSASMLKTGVAR